MRIGRANTPSGTSYGVIEDDTFTAIAGDPFTSTRSVGPRHPLSSVRLLSPVEPRRVLVVLGGFLKEGEDGVAVGTRPRLFPKVLDRHGGPGDRIMSPEVLTAPLMMEAELAVVIGRPIHGVDDAQAWDAIFGFTVYNDLTASEFLAENDFYRAKSLDGLGSCGPSIDTDLSPDMIRDGLSIVGRVNGVEMQRQSTARYKFDPATVVAEAARYVTLLPGDVIALGTPPPPPLVHPGDIITAEVDGVGTLENVVA